MIIYNQDKIAMKYLINDKLVFDISSNIRLDDILTKLRNGDSISEIGGISAFYIDADIPNESENKLAKMGMKTYEERKEDSFVPDYNVVHDDEYEGDVDTGDEFHAEHFPPKGNKPFIENIERDLFQNYQNYCFNVDSDINVKSLSVDNENVRKQLIKQISMSLGIMPNLLESYPEATVIELKKMSALGDLTFDNSLYDFYSDEYSEILPNKETIEILKTLSAPERQNFDYIMNPTKITDICCKLKINYKNSYLTRDIIDNFLYSHIEAIDEIKPNYFKNATLSASNYNKLLEYTISEFENSNYHRAPRVIKDYVLAQSEKRYDRRFNEIGEAKNIVKDFNLNSLKKIANTGSLILYALADELDFNQIKQSHIDIIASLYPEECIKYLNKNHFIEFYKNHQDMTDEQLKTLLEGYNYTLNLAKLSETDHYITSFSITEVSFDKDKSIEEEIKYIKEFKGKQDCKAMENKYNYKFENNDLCIKGRNIEIIDGDLHMYTLQADDYRNFTVGIDTHCCQAYTGAGESCVWKLTAEPYAGVVVIEKKGQILAQGFVWTDESKDTIVFDNVEFADDRKVHTFNNIFSAWAKECPYSNVHVGTSYNENMQGWGVNIPQNKRAVMPNTIGDNRYVYSDYIGKSNPRAIKKDGRVTLPLAVNYRVKVNELVPSKYDIINDLGLGYLLSLGFTANKIIEIGNKINNNTLTDEEIKEIISESSNHKDLLNHLSVFSDELQLWFASKYPNEINLLKEPCERLAVVQLRHNPEMIKNISNPTEEMQMEVVSQNGLLFSMINNPTERTALCAVSNNGYALTLIPEELKTDEVIIKAIDSAPRIVLSLNYYSYPVLKAAIEKEPQIIGLLQQKTPIPEDLQCLAVSKDSSTILSIKNPEYSAIKKAIEDNGLLIRNFQRYSDLREIAIRQNPMAIGVINKPTLDECYLALSLNPKTELRIKDKDVLMQAKSLINNNRESINIEDMFEEFDR